MATNDSESPHSSFDIIDVHHHVGGVAGFVEQPGGSAPQGDGLRTHADVSTDLEDAEDLAARRVAMDRSGVHQAVLIPAHTYLRARGLEDTRAANDRLAAYRNRDTERFPAAFGIAEPTYGDEGLQEIARLKQGGFVGVSFHPRFQGVTLASPLVCRYVEELTTQGMVPLLHGVVEICDEALWRIEAVASSFPAATFIAVDVFGSHEGARECFSVAKRTPNIVFDTSLASEVEPLIAFAKTVGAHRLAFGTDQYSLQQGGEGHSDHILKGLVNSTKLSTEEKALILGGNTRRILGLAGGSLKGRAS